MQHSASNCSRKPPGARSGRLGLRQSHGLIPRTIGPKIVGPCALGIWVLCASPIVLFKDILDGMMRRKPLIIAALSLALSFGSPGWGVQLAMGQLARGRIQAKPRAGTPFSLPALPGQALGTSGSTRHSLHNVLRPLAQVPQGLIQNRQTTHHRAPEAEPRPRISYRGQERIGLPPVNGFLPARRALGKTPDIDSPSAALSHEQKLPPALRGFFRKFSAIASGSLGAEALKTGADAVFDGSKARDSQAPAVSAGRARRSLAPAPKDRLIKFDIDGVQLRLFFWALKKRLPDGEWLLPNFRILTSPEHGGAISWGGVTHPVGVTLPGWAIENTGEQYRHGANKYSNNTAGYNLNLPNIITYVLNFFPDAMVEAYAVYRPIVRTIWNAQTILRNVRHRLRPRQVRRHTMRSKNPGDLSADGDQRIVQAFINAIRKRDARLLIAVLNGTDANGHAYGPDSFEYLRALVQRDYDLGRVLQAVLKSGRAGEYSIMSGSDHGFEPERKPGDPFYDDPSVSKGSHGLDPEGTRPMSADSLAIFRILNVPEGATIRAGKRIHVLDSMAIALKILLRNQPGLRLPEKLRKSADIVDFGDRPIRGRFSGVITGKDHPLFRLREAYPSLDYPAGKEDLADLPPILQPRAQ